jgi:hypothetical protein
MNYKNRDLSFIGSLVLIIIIAIVFFVNRLREENLVYYLEELGDQLMAMVMDNQDKDRIRERYAEFLDQVRTKEMPAGDVEKVASRILNLSSWDTTLSEQDIDRVFDLSNVYPAEFSTMIEFPAGLIDSIRSEKTSAETGRSMTMVENEYKAVEKRLKSVLEVSARLKQMALQDSLSDHRKFERTKYHFDENLRIIIDQDLKNNLKNLQRELAHLENQKILIWQNDAAKKRQIALQKELQIPALADSLKHLKHLELKKMAEMRIKKDSLLNELKNKPAF